MTSDHEKDHQLIAKGIAEDWLADSRLLVHIAREHGFRVEDVSNIGLAPLIHIHDIAHKRVCFSEAESKSPSNGLRRGLESERN
jgi:hypothetical protein